MRDSATNRGWQARAKTAGMLSGIAGLPHGGCVVAIRPAKGGLESPRKQVRYFLLYHGGEGLGARAFGESRHDAKQRLPHGRDVSVGKIHSQRTMTAYLQGATAYAEWCHDRHGIKSVPEQLKDPALGKEWLADLNAHGLAPKTLGAYLTAVLKLVEVVCPGRRLAWVALRDGIPRAAPPVDRAWSAEEEARLIAHVTARDPELGLAMRLIAATGARIHEVLRSPQHWHHALHVGQLVGHQLQLIGKGGKERLVTLSPDLAAELVTLAGTRPPAAILFAGDSARLYGLLHRACATLDIRTDGMHASRYGYVQREHATLLAAGVSLDNADQVISRQIGHERPRITRRYLGRG